MVREVRALDDYVEAGAHDVVILALKSHQVAAVAEHVPHLFGDDSAVVTMQNGIPYWYFHRHGGALAGMRVASAHALDAAFNVAPCDTRTVRVTGSEGKATPWQK